MKLAGHRGTNTTWCHIEEVPGVVRLSEAERGVLVEAGGAGKWGSAVRGL